MLIALHDANLKVENLLSKEWESFLMKSTTISFQFKILMMPQTSRFSWSMRSLPLRFHLILIHFDGNCIHRKVTRSSPFSRILRVTLRKLRDTRFERLTKNRNVGLDQHYDCNQVHCSHLAIFGEREKRSF